MATFNNDHDLLIELQTKLDFVIATIKDIKDGTAKRIEDLEKQTQDNTLSIARIMTYGSAAVIVLGILMAALPYIHF